MQSITTTFFSTLDREQTIDCLKFLLLPWKWKDWKNGSSIKDAENLMKNYIGAKEIKSFYNGRTALYYALKTAVVEKGDEVIIQAYTCITVPNAIIKTGAKPIYCDIDDTLNIDPADLKKKITNKTKAIIIQHTFGTPAKIDEIKEVCEAARRQSRASMDISIFPNSKLRKPHPNPSPFDYRSEPAMSLSKGQALKEERDKKIILIEDCAHSLGAKYKSKQVGSFGDISMFSFGRDKVISSVNGGMMCVNNEELLKHTPACAGRPNPSLDGNLNFPPYLLIIRNLLYPILAEISLKWYNKLKIGKIIMYASKKLKLFPLILSKEEKQGLSPILQDPAPSLSREGCKGDVLHYQMPNILAYLLIKQFKKLDKYNEHRKKIAKFYEKQFFSTELHLPACPRPACAGGRRAQAGLGSGYFSAPKKQETKVSEPALKRGRNYTNNEPIFIRYTIFTEKAEEIIKQAKKQNIYLGDWYRTVIAPKDINLVSIGYEQNMCTKAERYASLTVNLPNHAGITMEDAKKVVDVIKELRRTN